MRWWCSEGSPHPCLSTLLMLLDRMRGIIPFALFFLLASYTVSGLELDWDRLKSQLNDSKSSAAKVIAKNWSKRPHGFFRGVNEQAWDKLVPLLSTHKIGMIKNEEFKSSVEACKVFSKYLGRIPQVDSLPTIFRSIFYGKFDEDTDYKIIKSLGEVPAAWIQQDGPKFVKSILHLQTIKSNYMNKVAAEALLQNPKNSCSLIHASLLQNFFIQEDLSKMTPECMAVLKGLDTTDLSRILEALPVDSFAKYNGPLFSETLITFSKAHLKAYGSLIKDGSPICQSLEMLDLPDSALSGITPRCLWGRLTQGPVELPTQLWYQIPEKVLLQFTPLMQSSWGNIRPSEFGLMPENILRIILSSPYACANFTVSILNPESMRNVSALCLYTILSRASKSISLGSAWGALPVGIISTFSEEMMEVFGKIDSNDFYHMPGHVLQVIVNSEVALTSLQKIANRIVISSYAESLDLTEESFARIARLVPTLAAQLLIRVQDLPDDIYASCDGNVLRSLNYRGVSGNTIFWDGLFQTLSLLDKQTENFAKSIKLISTKTAKHFCSTIKTFGEYLSLTWLRSNMSDACRLALPFDLNDSSLLIQAPELMDAMTIPWKEMLNTYDVPQWEGISSGEHADLAFGKLGKDCEFWKSASRKYPDFLGTISKTSLKQISPHCVLSLKKNLIGKCEIIPYLADEAFALYQAGELPCDLKFLSERQLETLSMSNVFDFQNPTSQERSRHSLSRMTVEDLESLNNAKLAVLTHTQMRLVPDEFREKILDQLFTRITFKFVQLSDIFSPGYYGDSTDAINLAQELRNLVVIYSKFQENDMDPGMARTNIVFGALEKVNKMLWRDEFVNSLFGNNWMSALALALSQSAGELQKYLQRLWLPERYGHVMHVAYTPRNGFDRTSALQLLRTFPSNFAKSSAKIANQDFVDAGGPMRIFVNQFLNDIQRDLIVPIGGGKSNMSQHGNVKFVWGISREIGSVVGLMFGKALQLNMKLPFALDKAFYKLIVDGSDKAIERYYKKTYSQEFNDFCKYLYQLQKLSTPEDNQLFDLLTRPDSIRFTTLSSAVDSESAKGDFKSKTNIRGCGADEGFEDEQELKSPKFLKKYLATIHEKLLYEFKAFVRQVIKGLGHFIPAFSEFGNFAALIMRPVAKFLPILLNAKPLQTQNVIERIIFNNDAPVVSLVPGRQIMASKVVSAFISSLDERKLAHFVGIITGAPTLSLDNINLTIDFYSSNDLEPINFDFCSDAGAGATDDDMPIVAPGEQYLSLFRKFAGKLPMEHYSPRPNCNPEGVGIAIGKPSTCAKSLGVYLQPAQSLFNSLVYQLNDSPYNLHD